MIPVLGIPILNRIELLDDLVCTIDHPIGRLVVIDNGDVVPADWHPAEDTRVIRPGWNLGCGAAWNLMIKATPIAPWWLITNHDIEFRPGTLEKVAQAVDPKQAAIYHVLGFAAFVITPGVIETVGWFDENFHPAYCEDIDYSRRCDLLGIPRINLDVEVDHVGSATIYGDNLYMAQNGRTYSENVRYYERKWGGRMHTGETFTAPFNGSDASDTRVSLTRLRELAWARTQKEAQVVSTK